MNVVDSSGWLEYFADGPNADFFAPAIEDIAQLIVPSLSLYEVYKRVFLQRDKTAALEAVAIMYQGRVVDLSPTLALDAAKLSIDLKLSMADSIMLTTAQAFNAVFWTQDAHFEKIPGVQFIAKKHN